MNKKEFIDKYLPHQDELLSPVEDNENNIFIKKLTNLLDNWISESEKGTDAQNELLENLWSELRRQYQRSMAMEDNGLIFRSTIMQFCRDWTSLPQPPKQPTKKRGGCNP